MPSSFQRLTRSLRFQLAFWNAGVLVVLVACLLVVLYLGMRFLLQRELEEVLLEDCRELEQLVASNPDPVELRKELARKATSHQSQNWFAQVWISGKLLADGGGVPLGAPLGPEDLMDGPQEFLGFRVAQKTAANLRVRVGSNLDFLADDLARIQRLLLGGGFVVAVISPLVGWLLAARAIGPVAGMLETARGLDATSLDKRLPVRGIGDELDRLAVTINQMLDRLGAYTSSQRDFVANAAHELRSPLAATRALLEVTLNKDRPVEEYRELMQDLLEQVESLAGLVNSLLLLAEGDAGRLHRPGATARLDQVVERAVEMFAPVADQKGVKLGLHPFGQVTVNGEPGRLRQVLSNLLDNALKFTPPGGSVECSLRVDDPAQPAWAILEVSDTGPGVPEESLERVFDRFNRTDPAHQPMRPKGGSGLGLSICRAIVRAVGGSIRMENRPTGGARLVVKLRCA
jgi:two-component system, OmpR family, heavy metal sensor histidine kinase CusS